MTHGEVMTVSIVMGSLIFIPLFTWAIHALIHKHNKKQGKKFCEECKWHGYGDKCHKWIVSKDDDTFKRQGEFNYGKCSIKNEFNNCLDWKERSYYA